MGQLACSVCGSNDLKTAWQLKSVGYFRCKQCQCIFAENVGAIPQHYYDNGYHEARGHGIKDSSIEAAKRKTFNSLLQLIPINPKNKHLLEVGCGTGDALKVAQELGFITTGIDISKQAIEAARRRFPDLNFICGQIEDIELPENFFNAIVMFDVIEHIPDPARLADKLARILTPEGYLLIVTPNSNSLSTRLLGSKSFHVFPEHVVLYSPKSLSLLFEQRGLKLIKKGFTLKWTSLDALVRHATLHKNIAFSGLIRHAVRALPEKLRQGIFPFNIGEITCLFKKF